MLPLWNLYLYPWALDPVVLCPLDVLLLLLSEQPQSPCGPEQNRSRKQIFAFGHFASIFEILPPLRSECGGALYLANLRFPGFTVLRDLLDVSLRIY